MTKEKSKQKPKKSELKKSDLDKIYIILDLHSEAIEDGNTIFDDVIKRLELLEKNLWK